MFPDFACCGGIDDVERGIRWEAGMLARGLQFASNPPTAPVDGRL
jgi:hypothetical protein